MCDNKILIKEKLNDVCFYIFIFIIVIYLFFIKEFRKFWIIGFNRMSL